MHVWFTAKVKSPARNTLSAHVEDFMTNKDKGKGKAVPITGPDRPRDFQEVKPPRFRDNGTGWW